MGRGGRCEVRKGAWTQEEDVLLRNCVQANGEGNWHQVPAKAGLNRCRKSCRLRWLNYLKPNLKRGVFEEDEVDLILKLHNLLGNRWSMIAKRLPGRTGNDVKNYWNTHLAKKLSCGAAATKSSSSNKNNNIEPSNVVRVQVIRPQPRTFKGKLWQWQPTVKPTPLPPLMTVNNYSPPPPLPPPPPPPPPVPVVFPPENEISSWWESLLSDNNVNEPIIDGSCAISQANSNNNAIGSSSSTNFEDSLFWTMLSEEYHINQPIWEKLGIDDTAAL